MNLGINYNKNSDNNLNLIKLTNYILNSDINNIVKFLEISDNINLFRLFISCETPLHIAFKTNNIEVISSILPFINYEHLYIKRDPELPSVFDYIYLYFNLETFKHFTEKSEYKHFFNETDVYRLNNTHIYYACKNTNSDVFYYIMDNSKYKSLLKDNKINFLYAFKNDKNKLKTLIDNGVILIDNKVSPLTYLSEHNIDLDILEYLLTTTDKSEQYKYSLSKEFEFRYNRDKMPLYYAIINKNYSIIEKLLNLHINYHYILRNYESLIDNDIKILELIFNSLGEFITNDVNFTKYVNNTTNGYFNILYYAFEHEKKEVIEFLLCHGVDINIKNIKNETVLFDLVLNNKQDAIYLALEYNIDKDYQNNLGKKAVDLTKDEDIIYMLGIENIKTKSASKY